MLPKEPKVKVVLTFNEDMLNTILKYQYFGNGTPPKVSDLTDEQFHQLTLEIQGTANIFADEIVHNSEIANEWLDEFMKQFEE